jgi:N-acetylglutamate synthase-like GNAT family acetyltransferase
MHGSVWIQFTWDLGALPGQSPPLDKRYHVGPALPEDADALVAAITRSYSMEQGWSSDLEVRLNLAQQLVADYLPSDEIDFIAVRHGNRIIAASAINHKIESPSQLPLGISVLTEYRSRGIGSFLLHESLRQLREKGLKTAHVVTRKGVTAERYLYSKFGATRSVLAAETASVAEL